jgi:hypothetical protein
MNETSTETRDAVAPSDPLRRLERAAEKATALVQIVQSSHVKFSARILEALGQEAFDQIHRGEVESEEFMKLANLFLRARSEEREDELHDLKREKLRRELTDQVNDALDRLAAEVERHPAARDAFELLRRELTAHQEDA